METKIEKLEDGTTYISSSAETKQAKQLPNGLDLTNEQLALSNRSVKLYKGILNREKETGEASLELGECLFKLKEQLGRGKWGEYCKAYSHVYSDRSVRRFIELHVNRTLVSDCKTQQEMFVKLKMLKEIELPEDDSESTGQPAENNPPVDGQQPTPSKTSKRKPPKKKSVYLKHVKKLNEVPDQNLSIEEIDQIIRESKPFLDWCNRQSTRRNLPVVPAEI